MGMYTGLRAKLIVKPEFRQIIFDLNRRDADLYSWEWLAEQHPTVESLQIWSRTGRCNFIPHGVLCCMPNDFSDSEDGEGYSKFDMETGEWEFCCSLKNYENEIRTFNMTIMAEMIERVVYCQSLYEGSWCFYETKGAWVNQVTHWAIPLETDFRRLLNA